MSMVSPREAAKLVGKLKQPSGMQRPTWRKLQKLLRKLCGYLPDPYPSIERLAVETGITRPTAGRLLARAEALGLISRALYPLPGRYDSYTFRLTFLDGLAGSDSRSTSRSTSDQVERKQRELRSPVRTTSVQARSACRLGGRAARQGTRPRKTNRYTGRCDVCAETVQAGEGFLHGHLPVHRECDVVRREDPGDPANWGTAMGEDPEAPLPVIAARPAKPQAYLAKYFEDRWNSDALRLNPEWRGVYRGIDLGAAIGYLQRTFLTAGYSVEHVEAMIDAFFVDLLNPHCGLEIREGQTAFQRFTGWWGHNPVPDPRIQRQKDARREQLVAAAREQARESDRRRAAAWARIQAADERGENAAPEDYRDAEMPVPRPRPKVVDTLS